MRVIQLIDSLEAGGAERVALNYANTLAGHCDESFLCASRQEGVLKQSIVPAVSYLFLEKRSVIDVKAIRTLTRYIKSNNITIMHAHASSFFLAALVKLCHPKLKLVWHEHFGNRKEAPKFQNLTLKASSLLFNAVIVVSEKLKEWSMVHLYSKTVVYLPNYVVKTKANAQTYLKGIAGKRIVCLANIRPDKDHLNVLKAFKILKDKHQDWSLHLIGKLHADVYAKDVKNYIKIHDLEEHVFFYNSCEDVFHVLSQATIGVLSSKSEGLPLSLLEYGLAKLPVVVTDVGRCAQVVKHQHSGLVVKPQSAIDFSEALDALMTNISKRDTFSKNLNTTVRQMYSERAVIHKLLNMYKAL